MTKKRRRVRVPARQVPKAKLEPVEEAVAENENGDYTEWTVADLRAECEERDLTTTGRKSTLVKRLLADDGGAEEQAPAPAKPKAKAKAKAKPRAKKVVVPVVEEPEPVELATGPLATFFDAMAPGVVYGVSRIDEDTWQFTIVDGISVAAAPAADAKGKGLRGDAFWTEVLTQEYYAFFNTDAGTGKAWTDMDAEEKYAFAEAQDIAWEEAEDEKVDMMRLVQALMKHYGIKKYKPEYSSKAQRDALR